MESGFQSFSRLNNWSYNQHQHHHDHHHHHLTLANCMELKLESNFHRILFQSICIQFPLCSHLGSTYRARVETKEQLSSHFHPIFTRISRWLTTQSLKKRAILIQFWSNFCHHYLTLANHAELEIESISHPIFHHRNLTLAKFTELDIESNFNPIFINNSPWLTIQGRNREQFSSSCHHDYLTLANRIELELESRRR